jgi:hypothetical protein
LSWHKSDYLLLWIQRYTIGDTWQGYRQGEMIYNKLVQLYYISTHTHLPDVIEVELDRNKMVLLFIDNKVPQNIINSAPM